MVKDFEINKHKNDMFRLQQLLITGRRFSLPSMVNKDMAAFLEQMK